MRRFSVSTLTLQKSWMVLSARQITHSQIIKKMQVAGYKSDKKGICHGYSCVAAQSFLTDQLIQFYNALESLNDKNTTRRLLKSPLRLNYRKLAKIPGTLSEKVPLFKIPKGLKQEDYYLHCLLTGIAAHHSPVKHPLCLNESSSDIKKLNHHLHKPYDFPQNAKTSMLHMPIDLTTHDKSYPIQHLAAYTGCYTLDDMVSYFSTLAYSFQTKDACPIAGILMSNQHAIAIGFRNNQWVIMDSNNPPPSFLFELTYFDHKNIALKVMECFDGQSKKIIMQSDFFALTTSNIDTIEQSLPKNKTLQWLHLFNESFFKAKLSNKEEAGELLFYAVLHNDPALATQLLQWGVDPDFSVDGNNMLFIAMWYGHSDMIELLLKYGANPYQKTSSADDESSFQKSTWFHPLGNFISSMALKRKKFLEDYEIDPFIADMPESRWDALRVLLRKAVVMSEQKANPGDELAIFKFVDERFIPLCKLYAKHSHREAEKEAISAAYAVYTQTESIDLFLDIAKKIIEKHPGQRFFSLPSGKMPRQNAGKPNETSKHAP